MNEFIAFLKTDWNALWAIAVVVSGGLWISTFAPTTQRRKTLTAVKAVHMMNHESAIMLDVREKNEFVQGHIPGSRNAPVSHLADMLAPLGIAKETPIILSCESGARANQAFKTLMNLGFQHTYLLESGLNGWRNAGLPVVKKG